MLVVDAVAVSLGGHPVLRGTSLSVSDGEVVAVLGPSGSGKTTLLRAVAGLVELKAGDILWDGRSVRAIPTHRRGFGLMFQGYALFPHMSVADNVA
ncbi:MAG TPA: ATP-binding cassette domain-containing protein, partial [Acidimicrobiia bacterium]|nr:ATP-binding cassette domain-containing protein [Acidimicrobiia bacterium]